MKRSFYDPKEFQSLIDRVNKLTPTTQPKWGTMDSGQMLAHCNLLYEQALGKKAPEHKPNIFVRMLLKRLILSEKPFKQNLPTGPGFKMTDPMDFERERKGIIDSMSELLKLGPTADLKEHAAMGKLKPEEWSWIFWKHLDHHLRQFGV